MLLTGEVAAQEVKHIIHNVDPGEMNYLKTDLVWSIGMFFNDMERWLLLLSYKLLSYNK